MGCAAGGGALTWFEAVALVAAAAAYCTPAGRADWPPASSTADSDAMAGLATPNAKKAATCHLIVRALTGPNTSPVLLIQDSFIIACLTYFFISRH
jgi:hypothetical protein